MLLQYLQGATFHSPPGQSEVIPGLRPPMSPGLPKTLEKPSKHRSMPASTASGDADEVPPKNYSSPTLAFSAAIPKPNKSGSFSDARQKRSSNGALMWHGKIEPMSIQISDIRYTDWLSCATTSGPDNPQILEPLSGPPSGSSFPDVAGTSQTSAPYSGTLSSSALLSGSSLYNMVGDGERPGFLGNLEFDTPSRDIAALGMSPGIDMDARWMTFVRDCGLIDAGKCG
jgi:hypothetical protein